jgi:hypothetical protein
MNIENPANRNKIIVSVFSIVQELYAQMTGGSLNNLIHAPMPS